MTDWLVVTNRRAGGARRLASLDALLDSVGLSYRRIDPESLDQLHSEVAAAVHDGITRFVAVGGDGTLNLVVNALMSHEWETPPVVAILPCGTGSDFARTFALPRDLPSAAARLAEPTTYRCDIGIVEGAFGRRHFINVLNVGVIASAAALGARLPGFIGVLRYRLAFWAVLPFHRPAPVAVGLGRRTISGNALNVVVANGQFFGGGFNIAPQAAAMDGQFDIEAFVCRRRDAVSLMARVVRGTHLRHPAVKRGRSADLNLQVPDGWRVEADGEPLGTGSVTVAMRPGAIDFVI